MLNKLNFNLPISQQKDWVNLHGDELKNELISLVHRLDMSNNVRENNMLSNMRLYSNSYYTNVVNNFGYYSNNIPDISDKGSQLVWNICKSSCDTISAKISKNRVKATIVTNNADFALQRKAKRIDDAVYAIMFDKKYNKYAKQQFLDSLIMGTGVIEVGIKDDEICYSRVFPFELHVDELDALYGEPARMYRYQFLSKDTLIGMYPKHKDKIEQAEVIKLNSKTTTSNDCVVVYSAWLLPSGETKGRHVIVINNCVLVDELYTAQDFPFIITRWSKPSMGFWGVSLIDELAPFQLEINKILYFVQQSMLLGHAPKWLVPPNGIAKGQMTNKIGALIQYQGNLPQYIAPQPIHNQVIEYLQMLKNEAFAQAGISQLSAQSQKPAGLNSGVALQTYNDIETERFVLAGQEFEEAHVDAFYKTLSTIKALLTSNIKSELSVKTKFGVQILTLDDVDIDNKKYFIQAFPTSALPKQPEARIQRLNDFMQIGIISPDDFIELLDMPDLDAFNKMRFSGVMAARDNIERILDGKDYKKPEQYDDIDNSLKVVLQAYLVMRQKDETNEYTLQQLRLYMDELIALQQSNQAPEGVMPAPEGAMPQQQTMEILQ